MRLKRTVVGAAARDCRPRAQEGSQAELTASTCQGGGELARGPLGGREGGSRGWDGTNHRFGAGQWVL